MTDTSKLPVSTALPNTPSVHLMSITMPDAVDEQLSQAWELSP